MLVFILAICVKMNRRFRFVMKIIHNIHQDIACFRNKHLSVDISYLLPFSEEIIIWNQFFRNIHSSLIHYTIEVLIADKVFTENEN